MRKVFIEDMKKKNVSKENYNPKPNFYLIPVYMLTVSLLLVLTFVSQSQAQTPATNKQLISEWQKTLTNSGEPEKRAETARMLAQSGNRKSAKVLIRSLKDEDENVREQVILALGQLRTKKAVCGTVLC